MQVPMVFGAVDKPFRRFGSVDHRQELAQENESLTSKCSILIQSCKTDNLDQFKSCLDEENCNIDIDNFYWLEVDPTLNQGITRSLMTPLMIAATFGSINVMWHIIDSNKADINKFAFYKNGRPQTALRCAQDATPPRPDVIRRLISASKSKKSWDQKLREVSRSQCNMEGYARYDARYLEDNNLEKFPTLDTAKTIRPTRTWMRRNQGRPLYEPEGSKESEKEYLDKKRKQELCIARLRSWPNQLVESQYQRYLAPRAASETSSNINDQPEPELAWIHQLVDEFHSDEETWKIDKLLIE